MSHTSLDQSTSLTLLLNRNQRGLAQYLLKQRAISHPSDLKAFIHGFNNSGLAFSIIDTGEGEQSADQALKIHFDHLIKDDYLFLGGLHSANGARLLLTYHPLLRDKVILLQTSAKNKRDPAYNAVKGSERKLLETVVSEGLFAEDTTGAAVAMDAFYADWEEEKEKEKGEFLGHRVSVTRTHSLFSSQSSTRRRKIPRGDVCSARWCGVLTLELSSSFRS